MNKEDLKYFCIFGIIILVVAGLMIWGAFGINKGIEKSRELKEELCIENNFTYIYKNDVQILNDCYNIKNNIIQYYNIKHLNGTPYLMRGIR